MSFKVNIIETQERLSTTQLQNVSSLRCIVFNNFLINYINQFPKGDRIDFTSLNWLTRYNWLILSRIMTHLFAVEFIAILSIDSCCGNDNKLTKRENHINVITH